MFTNLKIGVEADVKTRTELRTPGDVVKFSVTSHEKTFAVSREDGAAMATIIFELAGKEIIVHSQVIAGYQTRAVDPLRVTLTLADDGECRFKFREADHTRELACWQFRKRVLEDFFFNL
jgi:hypothetical protein